ncbi:MAG TPA: LytTR family DNA-binding domain-containing protein [Anditalea sp.]|nr:LytTR family DNA-binding domain-containing protein [Anditalea sp.]
MSKINCLLVDDEPPALKILMKYVAEVDQLKLIGSCNNAFKAMEYLQNEKIDLLFLDIKMPKLSGISFIKTLANPPKVIFTTAYKDFAVDAFELDAEDYLLKPFSFERFIKAINRIILTDHLPTIETAKTNPAFLYLKIDRKMVKVYLDEIIYIESLKDYVKIHRLNDSTLIVKIPISNLENMLPNNSFVRIHRSYLVSLNKITAYTSKDIEIGTIELPIGKVFSHQFSQVQKQSQKDHTAKKH